MIHTHIFLFAYLPPNSPKKWASNTSKCGCWISRDHKRPDLYLFEIFSSLKHSLAVLSSGDHADHRPDRRIRSACEAQGLCERRLHLRGRICTLGRDHRGLCKEGDCRRNRRRGQVHKESGSVAALAHARLLSDVRTSRCLQYGRWGKKLSFLIFWPRVAFTPFFPFPLSISSKRGQKLQRGKGNLEVESTREIIFFENPIVDRRLFRWTRKRPLVFARGSGEGFEADDRGSHA